MLLHVIYSLSLSDTVTFQISSMITLTAGKERVLCTSNLKLEG